MKKEKKEVQTQEGAAALVTIPASPLELFKPKFIDSLIAEVRKAAVIESPDAAKQSGRDAIKSMAYRVARTKTTVDGVGKELVADWKAKAKVVDEQRKRFRDACEEIAAEVRKPLTEWEEHQRRVQQHIDDIKALADIRITENARDIEARLKAVNYIVANPIDYGVRLDELNKAVTESTDAITAALGARRKFEEEQAELEQLRREKEQRDAEDARRRAEQERAERDKRIAEEAARTERERIEAESRKQVEQPKGHPRPEGADAVQAGDSDLRVKASLTLFHLGIGLSARQCRAILDAIEAGKVSGVSANWR